MCTSVVVKFSVSVPVFSLTIPITVLANIHAHNRSNNAWLLKEGAGIGQLLVLRVI